MRLPGLSALLVVVVGLGGASARGAAVTTGQRIGDAPSLYAFFGDPPLAADRSGRAFAVVADDHHLAVTSARRGRRFSAPRPLPGADRSTSSSLSVAGSGAAAVAWVRNDRSVVAEPESREEDCCDRVRAAIVLADGRRSRARTLSAAGGDAGRAPLALTTDRRAAVAFSDERGTRVASADPRSTRGFGAAQTLAGYGSVLHLWFVGRTPHVLVLVPAGVRRLRAIELFRRGGRTVSRERTGAFIARADDPSLARAADGRLLAVFERGDLGPRGRHVLLQRARSGRVTVRSLPGKAVKVAVALSAHHGWMAEGGTRWVSLRRLGGPVLRRVALRPGDRQNPTDLALGVDDRGRGALAGYDEDVGHRSRSLITVLGPGLRILRRTEVSAPEAESYVLGAGVSVLPQPGGRALVAFARFDVRAVRVGP